MNFSYKNFVTKIKRACAVNSMSSMLIRVTISGKPKTMRKLFLKEHLIFSDQENNENCSKHYLLNVSSNKHVSKLSTQSDLLFAFYWNKIIWWTIKFLLRCIIIVCLIFNRSFFSVVYSIETCN